MTRNTDLGAERGKKSRAKHKPSGPESMHPIIDRARRDAVMDAVSGVGLQQIDEWTPPSDLSSHAMVQGADAVPEGIFSIGDDKFTAVATVYITLKFGDAPDGHESANSFPSLVTGHFKGGDKAVIDKVTVDTSSFFD